MKTRLTIVLTALLFSACQSRSSEPPPASQDALKALGSTVPSIQFDRSFWQREHDANSSAWNEAKRLCGQTALVTYPNCLPVNDIMQADQQKKATEADEAIAKSDEMFKRGYQYDFVRKEWLPYHEMLAEGCIYSYPTPGKMTWRCPAGVIAPKGIPDAEFEKEGK